MKGSALWLTGILVAVFALQMAVPQLTYDFSLVSADVWSRPWTLLTAIFLHAGVAHLLFNGYGLALFGSILEEAVGTKKFLAIFFATGLISSIAVTFFYSSVVGASGAIFGVIGALAVLRPTMTVFVYYIPMPFFMAALIWAALDVFGFVTGVSATGGNVANMGHLSGLAAGVIIGLIIKGKNAFDFSARGQRSREAAVTVEEFDAWERKHMRRK